MSHPSIQVLLVETATVETATDAIVHSLLSSVQNTTIPNHTVLNTVQNDTVQNDTLPLHIEHATTYEQALAQLKINTFDICFVSHELDQQSGLALIQQMSGRTPMILIAASIDRDLVTAARNAGAIDCFDREELTPRWMERLIRQTVMQAKVQRQLKLVQLREERYALAVRGVNDGLWDWNLLNDAIYFSPRWKTMLGYADHEINNHLEEWFHLIHPDDLYWVKREVTAHLDGLTANFQSEYRMRHRDGEYRWMLSRGLAVSDAQGRVVRMAGFQTDITGWKQAEEKLMHEALHDTLTGLPNRVYLMERLRQALQLSERNKDYLFAVLFVDLDRFKIINDSLGHMVGDQLLVAIAGRLSQCVRTHDVIARLGGDEFVILLSDVEDKLDAINVAERVQKELALPFTLDEHTVFSGASIGIAFSTIGYEGPEDLLRDADLAMYRAKSQGRSRYEIFHPGMHSQAMAMMQMETDLRLAIERQELQLQYQPIVSLRTRQITGFEALVRWEHPLRGLVPPTEFVPLAEETGLINSIGWWVLREACQQMQQWQSQYATRHPLTVNVNLSSKQFCPGLTEQIAQVLEETGLDPRHLKLEITESLLMQNADLAVETLGQLKKLGIQLAIDDFGTGYSSLNYLHRFPIDTLKVDRSFISKIDIDGEQLAIVRTIMTLAWNLGMEVVAEGVETMKQLAQLRSLQCDYAQGYLFAMPLKVDAIEHLLTTELNESTPFSPSSLFPQYNQRPMQPQMAIVSPAQQAVAR